MLPNRLLVGVDFYSASREALVAAVSLGKAVGSAEPTILAHAYQDERPNWLAGWSETNRKLHLDQSESTVRDWEWRMRNS